MINCYFCARILSLCKKVSATFSLIRHNRCCIFLELQMGFLINQHVKVLNHMHYTEQEWVTVACLKTCSEPKKKKPPSCKLGLSGRLNLLLEVPNKAWNSSAWISWQHSNLCSHYHMCIYLHTKMCLKSSVNGPISQVQHGPGSWPCTWLSRDTLRSIT